MQLRRNVHGARRAQRVASGAVVGNPLTIFLTQPPIAWWRADRGVTNVAGACTALADQTANGHNLGLFTTGPTITASDASLGGKQTLNFPASTGLFCALVVNIPCTLLLIFKPTAWINGNVLLGDTVARGIADAVSSPNLYQNSTSYVNATPAALGSWYRVRGKFFGTVADALKVGATETAAGSSAGVTAIGTAGGFGINLAGAPGAGTFDFFEAVVLPGIATAGEYTAYDAYVASLSGSIAV